MAEWLIVAGTSLLIMATVGLLRQAAFRGHSTLLFLLPLAGWRQVQDHWGAYGVLALLRVLGVVCVLSGAGLFYLQQVALAPAITPGQILRGAKDSAATAFVRSPEASLLMARGEGRPLTGRIHGETLDENARVTLINGVLSVQEGEGFLPERSLSILLDWRADDIDERRTLLVEPTRSDGPALHLSWTPDGHDYPETRIFMEGYRLELAVAPLGDGRFSGAMQLVLPDVGKSYLVGNFTAHANQLRYRDGRVDLFFDHPDTLVHVAREYLQTQYPVGAVERMVMENVILRRAAGVGELQARIYLRDGTVERRRMELEESPVGWAVTPGSMRSEALRDAVTGGNNKDGARPADRRQSATVPIRRLTAFADLADHIGATVTVQGDAGQTHSGLLTRVAEGRLWLRMRIGAGEAEISVPAERVREVRLVDGTRLRPPRTEAIE